MPLPTRIERCPPFVRISSDAVAFGRWEHLLRYILDENTSVNEPEAIRLDLPSKDTGMRSVTRAVTIGSAVAAALTLAHAPAHAAPNPTVAMSTPAENMAVVSITNHLAKPNRCGARLNGFEEYSTPYTTVAPQSTITFTMTNVPGGNYSVWWGCNGYTGDRRLIMVGGIPHLDGKPQTVVSTG